MELTRRRLATAWVGVLAGLPTVTAALAAAREHLHLPSVLLLYLLVVVAIAVSGGTVPALVAAVSAFFLANWFFTPPFHRLSIDAAEDVLALAAFLVVAGVVSWLLRLAMRHAADAKESELKSALLAGLSHDLRTPLASIKTAVTSLLGDDVDWSDEERLDFLATIDEETDRLDALVGNLLDMNRISTGSVRLTRREVGLDELVPLAMAELGARADAVELDVPETLPRAWVDPGLFERAVVNVLENALKWSDGKPVRVEGTQRGPFVQVRVVDHGPGVDPALRERMFEPFQRLGDRRPGGVGLGLAVARGFVSAMDGRIDVEDTAGGGTTVVLSVPWVLP
ncbi:MAG TPA: DUF4118 domain-containing protein [Acidimicrobiales bacterium]|nr:DUF4118 domain-containing protein [Acidimicrobiales bacterium]